MPIYQGWITLNSKADIPALQSLGVTIDPDAIHPNIETVTCENCTVSLDAFAKLEPHWGQWVWGLELQQDNDAPPPPRPKHEIVLSALLTGVPVTLGDYTYRLFSPGDEVTILHHQVAITPKFWLGCRLKDSLDGYIGMNEFSLVAILNQSLQLTNADATLLAAQTALHKTRKP